MTDAEKKLKETLQRIYKEKTVGMTDEEIREFIPEFGRIIY